MGNNLKSLRVSRGWTQDKAAVKFGLSKSGYIKVESGERKLSDTRIAKAAEIYGVTPAEVVDEKRMAKVVGLVGAGGAVSYDAPLGDAEPDFVECPPEAPPETVAVGIRGDSLGAGFDGWYALYARRFDPMDESLIGQLCIVGTEDGRTLIKWVRRGSAGYILVSGTGAIEENVQIQWAAKVIDLRPRSP